MIELAHTIQVLRQELSEAMQKGDGEALRFTVESIELDLQVTVGEEVEAGGGVKIWLVDANAGAKVAKQSVQTVRLKLRPEDPDGKVIKVSDRVTGRPD